MTLVATSKIYIKKSLIMSLKIRKKMSGKYWTYLLMEKLPKNSSGYRKSLLIVAKWFSDNLPEHFF